MDPSRDGKLLSREEAIAWGIVELAERKLRRILFAMSEVIFEVHEDPVDRGFCASALGFGIHTQGESLEELRANIREAVDCFFDETMEAPKMIRLHFVRDELMAR